MLNPIYQVMSASVSLTINTLCAKALSSNRVAENRVHIVGMTTPKLYNSEICTFNVATTETVLIINRKQEQW